jgi:hypothetical protein
VEVDKSSMFYLSCHIERIFGWIQNIFQNWKRSESWIRHCAQDIGEISTLLNDSSENESNKTLPFFPETCERNKCRRTISAQFKTFKWVNNCNDTFSNWLRHNNHAQMNPRGVSRIIISSNESSIKFFKKSDTVRLVMRPGPIARKRWMIVHFSGDDIYRVLSVECRVSTKYWDYWRMESVQFRVFSSIFFHLLPFSFTESKNPWVYIWCSWHNSDRILRKVTLKSKILRYWWALWHEVRLKQELTFTWFLVSSKRIHTTRNTKEKK